MGSDSFIFNAHPSYIEAKYRDYKSDPATVDAEMQKFFEGFDLAISNFSDNGLAAGVSPKELQVWSLVKAYRSRGHLISKTNPIRPRRDRKPNLDLEFFGLSNDDLQTTFVSGKELGLENPTLANIIEHLKKIYCGPIGIEYTYINNSAAHNWIKERFEKTAHTIQHSPEKKRRILQKLTQTVVFEQFLSKKYVGQKRFSLEGGESTIPALDAIINKSAEMGVDEVVIGMAHRGRLNVLANIMQKTYGHIFSEFEGNMTPDLTMGDGDVKYHLGYSSQVETPTKTVHLKLVPNPSHLEAVNPVVEGFARAKADILYGSDYDRILPILIHGDAAVAGQGVVYEVTQMADLKGYKTGGTIHFVINNQIGFTTDFDDARSSPYCTGVAKVIQAPVLHVNGDDVEAVVYAVELATEFRQEFNQDVFIDMVCYRRHGHNESDEPKFTQPTFYKLIENHEDPRVIYVNKLVSSGAISEAEGKQMDEDFWKQLQDRLDNIKQTPLKYEYQEPELAWKALRRSTPEDFEQSPDTAVAKKTFDQVLKSIMAYPSEFKPLVKVDKLLKKTQKDIEDGKIDWATAELAAYGTILLEGRDVRISGQDVKRGTFSHRHAIIYDENTNEEYSRLSNVGKKQGQFRIYNSLLSEFAVLGFEFGYSLASPDNLVIWEAQFGDFANGAQTIIDQFITSSESKWQRMSGLTLLLPHGYEGQGPEHSSARLERFLQLCAEYNITVANITTPANFFHALRRQLARPFRKPLVVMSPKSLLRHPKCVSAPSEFTTGRFKEVLDDERIKSPEKVERLLLCSGKVYYDLLEYQEQNKRDDVAIVRLEQLFPLPKKQLQAIFEKYPKAKKIWVQEEPGNMGAWTYMLNNYRDLDSVTRKASASPAIGYNKIHVQEQEQIVLKAFGVN
ncbi:MAG: 2-oxoglutarate dehydrogenase E1 component [Chitinophagales bacterium]|nr:2-oxoglutarate dehydrogenase E1 component [Chitinophagales bacterium]